MRTRIIIAVILVILIVLAGFLVLSNGTIQNPFTPNSNQPTSKVTIDGHTFYVTLAKTVAQQEKGLSGKSSLPQDQGMLFLFQHADYYPFWMKDMKFPIDIIYIRQNKIVTIYGNAPAPKNSNSQLTIYRPLQSADTVLEINAGLSNTYNFNTGDAIKTSL